MHDGTRRVHEVLSALHALVDEVRDHLGVGLGREGAAAACERRPQLEVVLDDAVVDDDDLAGAMRMRVLLGGTAVRRPAGVADADGAADRRLTQ